MFKQAAHLPRGGGEVLLFFPSDNRPNVFSREFAYRLVAYMRKNVLLQIAARHGVVLTIRP
ncbi:hypothetical protein BSQ99_15535 [Serratia liquefaciens]|nr:hypothetical protein BSQ99_15535 [Serratia liquefaciens]